MTFEEVYKLVSGQILRGNEFVYYALCRPEYPHDVIEFRKIKSTRIYKLMKYDFIRGLNPTGVPRFTEKR